MIRDDFMFFDTFKDKIDRLREIYSDEEMDRFCMELVMYGVRREHDEKLDPYLEGILVQMFGKIERSKERKGRSPIAKKIKGETSLEGQDQQSG